MQIARHRFKSKFITEPQPLSSTGSSAEKTAVIRFFQRILQPSAKHKDSWYQRKKFAAKRIALLSSGRFFLISNAYYGNGKRHWLGCTVCGQEFLSSAQELREEGEHVCPFCHPETLGDLSRIGSQARIESFVYHRSQGQVILVGEEEPVYASHWYRFYCTLHRDAFQTTFSTFLANAGQGNGCPQCHQERGLRTRTYPPP